MAYLSNADYGIFGFSLLLSIVVGIFHACKARRNRNRHGATSHFLMGSRKMPVIPTALSLLTSFLSGGTVLGGPPEIYQRGVLFWVFYMFGSFSFLLSVMYIIPVIFKLSPTSVYEYFEKRFDSRFLRHLAAALFLVNTIFYMSVVMYAPAVALSAVTDLPDWPFILVIGCATTFYTSIGGLKAVVWTDTVQAGFMYLGIVTLVVKGTMDAGGFNRVWEISTKLGRTYGVFTQLNPSPAQYNSVWNATFGAVAYWLTLYGLNQMSVQRYCSLRSMKDVRKVMMIAVPAFIVLSTLALFVGLIAVAYYYGCDPLSTGKVDTFDKLTMLFAADVLGSIPGLLGLFLACLFSATLSTLSSGMNSMAAVTWEDIVKHHVHMTDAQSARLNKILVVVFGLLSTGLAFACEALGGIVSTCASIFGAIAGPLVGLIILGVLVPRANKYTAISSFLISEVITLWSVIGSFIYQPYKHYALDTYTTCQFNTTPIFKSSDLHFGTPGVSPFYKIGPLAYGLVGMVIILVIGTILSFIIPEKWDKGNKYRLPLTYVGLDLPWNEPVEQETELNDMDKL